MHTMSLSPHPTPLPCICHDATRAEVQQNEHEDSPDAAKLTRHIFEVSEGTHNCNLMSPLHPPIRTLSPESKIT